MRIPFTVTLHYSSQTVLDSDSLIITHLNALILRIIDKQYALSGRYQNGDVVNGERCITCQFDLAHYAHESLVLMALEAGLNALLSPYHMKYTLNEVDIV